jgi:hypothetical protein
MITEKTYKALKILAPTINFSVVMSAFTFANKFWGDDPEKQYLFTAVSNNGHGASASKKAWLCAGSYLSKLAKKGLVKWNPSVKGYHGTGYAITHEGLKAMKEYEQGISNRPSC